MQKRQRKCTKQATQSVNKLLFFFSISKIHFGTEVLFVLNFTWKKKPLTLQMTIKVCCCFFLKLKQTQVNSFTSNINIAVTEWIRHLTLLHSRWGNVSKNGRKIDTFFFPPLLPTQYSRYQTEPLEGGGSRVGWRSLCTLPLQLSIYMYRNKQFCIMYRKLE